MSSQWLMREVHWKGGPHGRGHAKYSVALRWLAQPLSLERGTQKEKHFYCYFSIRNQKERWEVCKPILGISAGLLGTQSQFEKKKNFFFLPFLSWSDRPHRL